MKGSPAVRLRVVSDALPLATLGYLLVPRSPKPLNRALAPHFAAIRRAHPTWPRRGVHWDTFQALRQLARGERVWWRDRRVGPPREAAALTAWLRDVERGTHAPPPPPPLDDVTAAALAACRAGVAAARAAAAARRAAAPRPARRMMMRGSPPPPAAAAAFEGGRPRRHGLAACFGGALTAFGADLAWAPAAAAALCAAARRVGALPDAPTPLAPGSASLAEVLRWAEAWLLSDADAAPPPCSSPPPPSWLASLLTRLEPVRAALRARAELRGRAEADALAVLAPVLLANCVELVAEGGGALLGGGRLALAPRRVEGYVADDAPTSKRWTEEVVPAVDTHLASVGRVGMLALFQYERRDDPRVGATLKLFVRSSAGTLVDFIISAAGFARADGGGGFETGRPTQTALRAAEALGVAAADLVLDETGGRWLPARPVYLDDVVCRARAPALPLPPAARPLLCVARGDRTGLGERCRRIAAGGRKPPRFDADWIARIRAMPDSVVFEPAHGALPWGVDAAPGDLVAARHETARAAVDVAFAYGAARGAPPPPRAQAIADGRLAAVRAGADDGALLAFLFAGRPERPAAAAARARAARAAARAAIVAARAAARAAAEEEAAVLASEGEGETEAEEADPPDHASSAEEEEEGWDPAPAPEDWEWW